MANSLGRWFGEPVRAALIHTHVCTLMDFTSYLFYISVLIVSCVDLDSHTCVMLICQSFLINARGYPCLSKRHQNLLTGFFNHSVQVLIFFMCPFLVLLLPFVFYFFWGWGGGGAVGNETLNTAMGIDVFP